MKTPEKTTRKVAADRKKTLPVERFDIPEIAVEQIRQVLPDGIAHNHPGAVTSLIPVTHLLLAAVAFSAPASSLLNVVALASWALMFLSFLAVPLSLLGLLSVEDQRLDLAGSLLHRSRIEKILSYSPLVLVGALAWAGWIVTAGALLCAWLAATFARMMGRQVAIQKLTEWAEEQQCEDELQSAAQSEKGSRIAFL